MDVREYELEYFKENEFIRKKCGKCGSYFWTRQNDKDRNTCGDAPCEIYSFIGSPIFKEQSLDEMRELFLSFFEERSHTRLKRYPVVARWRDDIYLNIASIANFQPFVTAGKVPPPANPLVISQPCIRLEDLESIGKTGRHLTTFEMMGHHAFNRRGAKNGAEEKIYWKNETVRYCDEFLNKLGVEMASVTYKEAPWAGGGNAGPCLEVITGGLELATLVFMDLELIPRGSGSAAADSDGDIDIEGERYRRMDTYIVDTGYGLERFVWASKGTPTIYDAIFPEVIKELVDAAWIEHPLEKHPEIKTIYAVADHTKCLAFMLADGIVPSNAREGYLARLILRRTFRLLKSVGIETPLEDIVLLHIKTLESSFPELGAYIDRIVEIISLEKKRYGETLLKGERIIRQLVKEYNYNKDKKEKKLPIEQLITLYDTHGLPPEFVKEVVSGIKTTNLNLNTGSDSEVEVEVDEEVEVDVPENFYTLVARMHSADRKYAVEQELEQEPKPIVESMKEKIKGISETIKLYYDEPVAVDFEATVLASIDDFVILDRTLFFPEGGGQPADTGFLSFVLEAKRESESECSGVKEEVKVKIVDVQEIDGVILHKIEDGVWSQVIRSGSQISGSLDRSRRIAHKKHHTATHIVVSAAQKILGDHVWQAGAQKGEKRARIDITHFKRISNAERQAIEMLANKIVMANSDIKIGFMDRNEAEQEYGLGIYQGGVPTGEKIRIVRIGSEKEELEDVQACAGIHLSRTGECGTIKLLRTERIQDGIERIEYAAGEAAIEAMQRQEELIRKSAAVLKVPSEKLPSVVERFFEEWKQLRKETERLRAEISDLELERLKGEAEEISISCGVNVKVISAVLRLPGADTKAMMKIASQLSSENFLTILVSVREAEKRSTASAVAVVSVPTSLLDEVEIEIHADEIIKRVCDTLGGSGGGKSDIAQGGGPKIELVDKAREDGLNYVKEILKRK